MKASFLFYNIQYFLKSEFLSKFNFKNLYKLPIIESIILSSPITSYSTNKLNGLALKPISIYQMIFFIFYFYFSLIPSLSIVYLKSPITLELEKNYFLKIIFSKNSNIFNFLFSMLLENYSSVIKSYDKSYKISNTTLSSFNSSHVISTAAFNNFVSFIDIGLIKVLLNDLQLNLNLLIKNSLRYFNNTIFQLITHRWLV